MKERTQLCDILDNAAHQSSSNQTKISEIKSKLMAEITPSRKDVAGAARKALRFINRENIPAVILLRNWLNKYLEETQFKYSSYLYLENDKRPELVQEIKTSI
ncbi:hypothetical protein CCAN11_1450008 [Capnocytophaga canimorsus]|uniref:Uncharacterized protein n=1 Tax=Capnocytophaga canimorsus TaxID=28188 RepID=A0A0B7IC50_9FLAO|nr:hypothetical protein CCAN11_1450008 [Capnocytophaga canimorsus]